MRANVRLSPARSLGLRFYRYGVRLRSGLAAGLLACGHAWATGSPAIVISQVYGGGGNTGATYKNDFVELHNVAATNITITGWTVQYASSTGSTWAKTALNGIIPPGCYYLIQEDAGTSGDGLFLPTPDATGAISMSYSAGKVALVCNGIALSGANPLPNVSVADFVGYGTTASAYEGSDAVPPHSNTRSIQRLDCGTADTDDNDTDFVTGTPSPHNSASPRYPPPWKGTLMLVR